MNQEQAQQFWLKSFPVKKAVSVLFLIPRSRTRKRHNQLSGEGQELEVFLSNSLLVLGLKAQ